MILGVHNDVFALTEMDQVNTTTIVVLFAINPKIHNVSATVHLQSILYTWVD